MAFAWKSYLDPLTGFALRGYIGYVGFQAVLAGAIAVAFSWRRRWLGSVLSAFALFLALPLPSKRGIDLRVENATSEPAQVTVVREDTCFLRSFVTFQAVPIIAKAKTNDRIM